MFGRIKKQLKPDLQSMNVIEISKANILHNIAKIRKMQSKWAIFPVLKSNAYGHGMLQMLEILKGQDFPYLAVDSLPERQMIVRNSDFKVLLMGETIAENYRFFDFERTAFAVSTIETLRVLAEMKRKVTIHLFLNTGMNREGIQDFELFEIIELLKQNRQVKLEGLMSHLHSADEDFESIEGQIKQFKQMSKAFEDAGFEVKWRHIAASAGIVQIEDDRFTACRPGILMYGYCPVQEQNIVQKRKKNLALKPALSLFSTIIKVQKLKMGDGVSYNHLWKSDGESFSATVPFGYYEGRTRNMSGKLTYSYQGRDFPQIGRICMNISCMQGSAEMKKGEIVCLISQTPESSQSVAKIAEAGETLVYEVLIRLDKSMRRVVVD